MTPEKQRLRRVLGLKDLILYGVVLIQPIGAVGIYGIVDKNSFGHVTTTILIALVAMMLTAVSYGRMAGLYPAAGSAYTYVGRGLNPHLGFLAGWAMFLDYLVIPIVSVVYGALTIQKLIADSAPGVSFNSQHSGFVFWTVALVILTTLLNVRGIKWTALTNYVLTIVMFLVLGIFIVQAAQFLLRRDGVTGLFSILPFYNPKTFNLGAVGTATSVAALTYIGFDGITTLAEDTREPKRSVPLAILIVCAVIGACAFLQVYLAHLVWPDYNTFPNLDTAFFDVCRRVGGTFLFDAMTVTMAVALVGSALTGQVGAARILFGMGRDKALPAIFARLDRHNNPVLNIWLIGILMLAGSLLLNYEQAATLINFGAFLAFLGVNAAVIREFFFHSPTGHRRNFIYDAAAPGLGFLFCFWIWIMLPKPAKIVGGIWCAVGLIYAGINTRGFRSPPAMIDLKTD